MEVEAPRGLLRMFDQLEDPRVDRAKRHSLYDILVITVCGVICGADNWTEIELFGRSKQRWLRTFLALPNGIPSHDTFGRVFARLAPEQLEQCFLNWTAALASCRDGRLVAIDGKTLRRSFDKAGDKTAIHMVSAWCELNQMVLGQLATDVKSNEITANPSPGTESSSAGQKHQGRHQGKTPQSLPGRRLPARAPRPGDLSAIALLFLLIWNRATVTRQRNGPKKGSGRSSVMTTAIHGTGSTETA